MKNMSNLTKLTLTIIMLCIVNTAAAQDDDWQIGGGEGSTITYLGKYSKKGEYSNYRQGNLFNGGHKDVAYGLVIGYVNKAWNTDFGSYKWKENIWGEEGKRLHGVQVGLQYTPCFKWGLGVHTGLFYEAYFSESHAVKEAGWDNFTENNIYIPAHLSYRVPFSRDCSLTIYGGIGFQWAISSEYSKYDYRWHEIYDREYQRYGDGWPKRVNWQGEIGANLRFKVFQIGCSYSRGLTDHQFYPEAKTRQDKFAINIGIVAGDL